MDTHLMRSLAEPVNGSYPLISYFRTTSETAGNLKQLQDLHTETSLLNEITLNTNIASLVTSKTINYQSQNSNL